VKAVFLGPTATGPARCDVDFDLDARTLDITSYGLWNSALVDEFLDGMAVIQWRYDAAGIPPRQLHTVIDLRHHAVQVRETIERLAPEVHRYHDLSKRTAILLSHSALAKMQAERFLTLDRHRFFTSETLARDWLENGDEPEAAAA
jgi:hypothetical protein